MLDNVQNEFSVEKARNLLKKKTENMLTAARCMSKVIWDVVSAYVCNCGDA